MQRILVLTGIFPNRRNPTLGIHVFQNVAGLAAHATVQVVAPVPFVPSAFARGRYAAYAGVPSADRMSGIPVSYPRFLVVPKVARFLHGFGLFISILPAVTRQIRSFRPSVVLTYFAYPYGVAAVLFGSLFRLPVVISCRGSDINAMTAPRLQGWLIARALRACRRVLVVSTEMQERVLALGVTPARVEVVSNGVDAGTFFPRDRSRARAELKIPDGVPVVLCVGRLSAEKGIDVLIDAAAMIRLPGLRICVVGDGVLRSALESRAAAAGVGDVVAFAGTRPHAEVPVWLAAADVVALPSRSEGMPNAVLEAMASGRFVVASDVGGVRELITDADAGRMVPAGDAGALAEALSSALSSAHDPDRIAAGVKMRTWDAVGRRTADILAAMGTPVSPQAPPDVAGGKTWHTETR